MDTPRIGQCLDITEKNVTLTYRIVEINSMGFHLELLHKPWLKYLLIPTSGGFTLYFNHGPVTISPQSRVIPSYNPELEIHPEQDVKL